MAWTWTAAILAVVVADVVPAGVIALAAVPWLGWYLLLADQAIGGMPALALVAAGPLLGAGATFSVLAGIADGTIAAGTNGAATVLEILLILFVLASLLLPSVAGIYLELSRRSEAFDPPVSTGWDALLVAAGASTPSPTSALAKALVLAHRILAAISVTVTVGALVNYLAGA